MDTTRYQYVNIRRRRSPVTVAYIASEADGNIIIALGASFCHSSMDRFNRKRGREIAEGRLERNPLHISFPIDRSGQVAFGKIISTGLNTYVASNARKIIELYTRQ